MPEETIDVVTWLTLDQPWPERSVDLPEGSRQILMVTGYNLFSESFRASAESGTDSKAVVVLRGHASPNSAPELKMAYVSVVPDTKNVRVPSFSRAAGAIRLEIHARNLPMLLAQLKESNVYCWVGHFPGGHIYGDVHTS